MNRLRSQISVGVVCVLLGFMITYQLKSVMQQKKESDEKRNVAQITIEIEQLKKQKQNLEDKVNELQAQIKNYENAASSNNEMAKEIVKKLEDTRILTGNVDVEGEGVIIYLTPQSEFFGGGTEGPTIIDTDLIKIVNELNAADAEAISINDIRVTSRTGIRSASNYITINEERISPYKRITIKAIGNKINLKKTLEFPGVLDVGFDGCEVKYEVVDKVQINKYDKSLKLEYAKPIKDK
ncbi:DUF881 domain-containing protein [Clostridium bovifaecis]|uniref:DUF881 domain-containing protein n=1 Tax=Clostridium bovifaecis TaxID=2184719 RepID=A0A6I6F403_9CLOT|nr:DUF881 domain-containing protein [Clostridium bovifaecis]